MSGAALDAIVLAGGRGSRLGGVDKAALRLNGERLVERAVAAARVAGAVRIAVVGPNRETVPGAVDETTTVTVREDPPFSGPLAALAVGLDALRRTDAADWVLLLACDLVEPAAVCEVLLAEFPPEHDGVLLSDPADRAQWLAGIYRVAALRNGIEAVDGPLAGLPLRLAFSRAELDRIRASDSVTSDIDTPADLTRARREAAATVRPSSEDTKELP